MILDTNIDQKSKEIIKKSIRVIPDYPKQGIMFQDITTMIAEPKAMKILMDHLQDRYSDYDLDFIAGIEARGFIFGSILADRLGIGFVPIRKQGKLPYTTISQEYTLEYGTDIIEMHIDSFDGVDNPMPRVLLIDDLLATGGTASAACRLIQKSGAICAEACFVMELGFLKGADAIDAPVYSVIISQH